MSGGNDSIQVTFEKERATKAEAGSSAIIITASGHMQMFHNLFKTYWEIKKNTKSIQHF